MTSFPIDAGAAQTLTIDVGATKGRAGNPIASGFRGQWANTTPHSVLYPLKPSLVGGPAIWPNAANLWNLAAATGATVEIFLPATLPDSVGTGLIPGVDPHGDPSDVRYVWSDTSHVTRTKAELMGKWTERVRRWVRFAENVRHRYTPPVPVIYEVWNEPDGLGEWNPGANPNLVGEDPVALFMELWAAAYHTVRDSIPDADISGPSFACDVLGAPPETAWSSGVRMQDFLKSCDSLNCMPTILSWHDIGNWDYADTDLANELHSPSTDLKWNLHAQVDYAKRLMADSTAEHILIPWDRRPKHFNVNESMPPKDDVTPGIMVREFALAERARSLGLMNVSRSLWPDPCIEAGGGDPDGTGNSGSLTVTTHLCGLVHPCCDLVEFPYLPLHDPPYSSCVAGNIWQRRYAWWTQKFYADLEGTFVRVSPTIAVDGLAAMTADGDSLRILAGKFGLTNEEDVRIVLKRITPLAVNDAVQVAIRRLDVDLTDPYFVPAPPDTLAPTFVRARREIVIGDSCVVEIPANDFGPGDALMIEVTKITPGSTIARGE